MLLFNTAQASPLLQPNYLTYGIPEQVLPSLASGSFCLDHFPSSFSAVFPPLIFQDSSWVSLPPRSPLRFSQPGLAPPEQEIGPLSTVPFLMPDTEEGLGECLSNECVNE